MGHLKTIFSAGLLLAACSSPSIQYSGIEPQSVEISGIRFDVFSNGVTAQAIRLSRGKPEVTLFRISVIQAIENATGCVVDRDSLEGDFVVVNAAISCDL